MSLFLGGFIEHLIKQNEILGKPAFAISGLPSCVNSLCLQVLFGDDYTNMSFYLPLLLQKVPHMTEFLFLVRPFFPALLD